MMPSSRPISTKDLMELIKPSTSQCVSVYLPTSRTGNESTEGRILLKTLLRSVEDKLRAQGRTWEEVAIKFGRAFALVNNPDFWEYQAEGLAIFMSKDFFRMFKLPIEVPVLEVVADRFHVTPLLQLLDKDENFYVLVLCENEVRLFDATCHTFEEVHMEGLPKNMAEALWKDDPKRKQLWDSESNSTQSKDRSIFSCGSTNASKMEKHKADYKDYFKLVDAALMETFKLYPAPIVLAGVSYLLPIYREVNQCAGLLRGEVHGNEERMVSSDIHRAAWEVSAMHFSLSEKAAKESFQYALSRGSASYNPSEISRAAEEGRIAKLFISVDGDHALSCGLESSKINSAALSTLSKGGEVFALTSQEMPLNLPVAATFRY